MTIKLLTAILTSIFLISCQSNGDANSSANTTTNTVTCAKGSAQCCGKTRGTFLGDWFDYYERGLSYADCLMWQEAYKDLSTAISKRGQDKRRVYTLGMHFITNYFPHREIGIVLYNQGKYQQAKQHLETSIVQFPSTKAETYLNKTRVKLESVIDKEKSAPKFALLSRSNWSNQKGRSLELTITDDTFIDKVWIDGELFVWQDVTEVDKTPVSIQRAKALIQVNKVITSSKTEIIIAAEDIFGNKSTKTIENKVDVIQPEISIQRIEENEFGEVEVVGIISDRQSGIAWVNVGGENINVSGQNTYEFSFVAETDVFDISAQDIAGNQLSLNRAVKFSQPITIDLQSEDVISTQENSWILSSWLESSHDIGSYTINGKSFTSSGARLHISHELDLAEGVNTFELSVEDESGQSASKIIQITRTVPHHLASNERLVMALFPFACDQNTGVSCDSAQISYQQMDESVRARKRFQLVERATLSSQLDSLKICELMVTDKCAWQTAQLVRTQSMFVGEMIVRKSAGNASEEVYARIIDAVNGSVLISFDAYRENQSQETVNKQLYVKLHERFPLLSTENILLDDDEITADFGSGFQLWKNMPMKLFSDEKACAQGLVVEQDSKTKIELNERCKAKGKKRLVTL
ncbi:hypothetical protein [Thalassotalea sp. ND16A]|uniref:hypothetical protein n=1 Tax=Thalassotalea sp. ND16A TaxID=1535422 RepID=UPI00051A4DFB|nr:hypothetical protein [Thalassotalea sp. ND16A]